MQRGDDAGCAKAALGAVIVHHRLLDRAERAIGTVEIFHAHHMGGVKRADKTDAGIHRFINENSIVHAADQHGACAAIALGTAFLAAGQAAVEPEPVEQGEVRCEAREFDRLIVEQESDECSVGLSHVAS